ncbi:MAG: hypothetical protein PSX36_04890 [bacterium]|nr:hypothetical protein [bacterium]
MTNRKYRLILTAITAAVLVYVMMRAYFIPITHDEAYSFHNMKRFWYAEALCTGNTHWLNSMALKVAILLQQESVFALRWFSLLSATVFFWITWQWAKSKTNFVSALFVLSVCLLNPYVLDYFSIARGYASGLLFESLSLLFFFRTTGPQKKGSSFLSLLFAGLAAISNFSFFYFFVAFSSVYFTRTHFLKGITFVKTKEFYRDSFFVSIVSLLVARALLFITRCSNDVVGAGTQEFSEFCAVFTEGLFQLTSRPESPIMLGSKWAACTLIILSTLSGLLPGKKTSAPLHYYAALILLCEFILIFSGHFFFQFVLPASRSALFLFPLTVVCFVEFLESLSATTIVKKMTLLTGSVFLIVNFLLHYNSTSVVDYHAQADLKKGMDFLEKNGAVRVGMGTEVYGGFRNYFQMTEKYNYSFAGEELRSRTSGAGGPTPTDLSHCDFLIVVPPYDLTDYRCQKKLSAAKFFPQTGTLILKVD